MNKRQKIALWIGIGILALIGVFPPRVLYGDIGRSNVDVPMLMSRFIVITIVTAGAVYTLGNRKS